MGQLGATWVRTFLRWDQVEPGGPGRWDRPRSPASSSTPRCAQLKGIKVVAVVTGAPQWANGSTDPYVPPRDPQDFARFLGTLAARERGKVAAWEIWNEPDEREFWHGAGRRAALRAAAHRRASRRSARPIPRRSCSRAHRPATTTRSSKASTRPAPATRSTASPSTPTPPAWSPRPTRTTARPTVASAASASSASARSHAVLERNGHADRPIIMTEIGWSATKTRCSRGASRRQEGRRRHRGPAGRLPQARLPLPQLLPVRQGRALVQPDRHGAAGHRADALRPAALRRLAGARRSTRSRAAGHGNLGSDALRRLHRAATCR